MHLLKALCSFFDNWKTFIVQRSFVLAAWHAPCRRVRWRRLKG
jgi:hypothetical protein